VQMISYTIANEDEYRGPDAADKQPDMGVDMGDGSGAERSTERSTERPAERPAGGGGR